VSPIGIGDADRCGIADRPGESEKLHMVVPEQHYVPPLVLVAVPRGILGRIKPRVFPNPVALDDFGDGPNGDFRAFDGCASGLGSDVFDAPGIAGPLRAIAVAVFQETVFGSIVRVPFVRGAVPALRGQDVFIQGAIRGVVVNSEIRYQPERDRGRFALLTAEIPPTRRDRVGIAIVFHVQRPSQAELMIIVDALRPLGGFFCAGQGGEQHRGKDGDDGDDD